MFFIELKYSINRRIDIPPMNSSKTPLMVEDKPKHRLNTYFFYIIYIIIFSYFCIYWRIPEIIRGTEWMRITKGIRNLEDGWIPGRKIDLSDQQYRNFRPFFFYIVILILIYTTITNFIKKNFCTITKNPILYFYSISSIVLLYFCFGNYLIFPLGISLVSFSLNNKKDKFFNFVYL